MAAKRQASGAPLGELSNRLRDLFSKTVVPQPYPVTDTIIIAPPTKAAWAQLDELENRRMAAQFLLADAWKRLGAEGGPTRADIDELTTTANDAQSAYDDLFFGEHYEALKAVSASWEREHWNAFCRDIKNHFLGVGPATGACPHCGTVVDAEAAGKDSESST